MSVNSDLMVDIETLATTPDAAIITIGACAFDKFQPDVIHDSWEIRISFKENTKQGRAVDGGTIEWWFSQNKDAQLAALEGTVNLQSALKQFRMWIENTRPMMQTAWANDPDFDIIILQDAFKHVGEWWPFHFSAGRSCRTIFELAYPDLEDRNNMKGWIRGDSTHHDAKDDAVAQARMVQHCHKVLGLS